MVRRSRSQSLGRVSTERQLLRKSFACARPILLAMKTLAWRVSKSKPELIACEYGKRTCEKIIRVRDAHSLEFRTSLFAGDCALLYFHSRRVINSFGGPVSSGPATSFLISESSGFAFWSQ